MKKFILLAAVAAVVAPTGAVAQQHDRHGRTEVRQANRTVRADTRTVRADRRVVRADRQVMRTNHNAMHRTRSAYVAPVRNWTYRPVNVGYRLQPSFYGSRYYISDYGSYNLRAPGRWQRWIRYGNDLLLINTRTGRVLQVVHYAGW